MRRRWGGLCQRCGEQIRMCLDAHPCSLFLYPELGFSRFTKQKTSATHPSSIQMEAGHGQQHGVRGIERPSFVTSLDVENSVAVCGTSDRNRQSFLWLTSSQWLQTTGRSKTPETSREFDLHKGQQNTPVWFNVFDSLIHMTLFRVHNSLNESCWP